MAENRGTVPAFSELHTQNINSVPTISVRTGPFCLLRLHVSFCSFFVIHLTSVYWLYGMVLWTEEVVESIGLAAGPWSLSSQWRQPHKHLQGSKESVMMENWIQEPYSKWWKTSWRKWDLNQPLKEEKELTSEEKYAVCPWEMVLCVQRATDDWKWRKCRVSGFKGRVEIISINAREESRV